MSAGDYKRIVDGLSEAEYQRVIEYIKNELEAEVPIGKDRGTTILEMLDCEEADMLQYCSSKEEFLKAFEQEPDPPKTWQDEIITFPKTNRQKQIERLERELEQKTRELIKLRPSHLLSFPMMRERN